MKEAIYLLALFRFQCLPHYIYESDNEVLSKCVNVLVFFNFFIIVNSFLLLLTVFYCKLERSDALFLYLDF